MSASRWILERNRDVAQLVFGEETADRAGRHLGCRADDEAKAAGLTPFIVGGLAVAAFGGRAGLTRQQRTCAAGIAALLFIAI